MVAHRVGAALSGSFGRVLKERDDLHKQVTVDGKNAARYQKLQRYMGANVKEGGWDEVEKLGGVCAWMGFTDMDQYLDSMPECNAGLCESTKRPTSIELTPAEIQSGYDRVKWADGLIRQLPETHEGRNSWLLNYGTTPNE